jgi:hypothetical protein
MDMWPYYRQVDRGYDVLRTILHKSDVFGIVTIIYLQPYPLGRLRISL